MTTRTVTRRVLLTASAMGLASVAVSSRWALPRAEEVQGGAQGNAEGTFEVTHTDAEWRKLLNANQYAVLR